jgi:hypothetical protein
MGYGNFVSFQMIFLFLIVYLRVFDFVEIPNTAIMIPIWSLVISMAIPVLGFFTALLSSKNKKKTIKHK